MKSRILTATGLFTLIGAPAAIAQDQPASSTTEKVNQVIVYDQRDCPEETSDMITSCIVVTGESPYRIPRNLRGDPNNPQNISATRTAEQDMKRVRPGFGSCDATGTGVSNCSLQAYDQYRAEREQRDSVRYGRLIEIERQRRLGLIDDEAAEQEKKEIMEEQRNDVPPAGVTVPADAPPPRDLTKPQ